MKSMICCRNCQNAYKDKEGHYMCRAYKARITLDQEVANCLKSKICYTLLDRTEEINKKSSSYGKKAVTNL